VILTFSVHTSVELSRFIPRIFVGVSDEVEEVKKRALSWHASQDGRLQRGSRLDHEILLGAIGRLARAEAFEVNFQAVEPALVRSVLSLSDSPFHSLWSPILGDGMDVFLIHEKYLVQPLSIARHSTIEEPHGRTTVREAFQDGWLPKSPLRERHANDPDAMDHMRSDHVILAGGAVSNPITAEFFNRFSLIDYVIECDQPGSEPVYLLQRSTGKRWFPEFDADGELIRDVAVLSVLPSPMAPGKTLVGCAGVHGRGTEGLLVFLSDPSSCLDLFKLVMKLGSCNIPVYVNHIDLSVSVMPEYVPTPLRT
jgi:hypothetical protein